MNRLVRWVGLGAFAPIACAALVACAALESWDRFDAQYGVDASDGRAPRADASGLDAGDGRTTDAQADAGTTPIAVVQSSSTALDDVLATTVQVPINQPSGAGNLVVVAIGWFNRAELATVTDSVGNTYRLAIGPTTVVDNDNDPIFQSIYYASGIKASPLNTLTVTWRSTADSPDVRVVEYSGLDPVSPLDATSARPGSGAAVTSGAVTTRYPRELLVGAGSIYGDFTAAGPPFMVRLITTQTNLLEDRIVGETGSYSADAPAQANAFWVMQLATFH